MLQELNTGVHCYTELLTSIGAWKENSSPIIEVVPLLRLLLRDHQVGIIQHHIRVSSHIAGGGCTQQSPHNLPTVVPLYTPQAEYTYSTGL